MKANYSEYLTEQKSLAMRLVKQLSQKYKYVSLLGVDTTGKRYFVKKTGTTLEDSFWVERGYVVRVYNGKNYTEHSFNILNEQTYEDVLKALDNAVAVASMFMNDDTVELEVYDVIDEEAAREVFYSNLEKDYHQVSHDNILKQMEAMIESAMKQSELLVDVRISYEEVHISKMFLSSKRELEQAYVWSNGAVIPIIYADGSYKYSYEMVSGLKGTELLDEISGKIDRAVKGVQCMVGSTPIKPGEYDIILDPDLAGLLAHEAFGHGVEMDMFVKNRAKAAEYIDKSVASPLVDMFDGAESAEEVSSYLFDDEGVFGTDTKIIDKGVLKSGITDMLSAMKLGVKPTGNGKRESYEHKVYSRMTNTFFAKGDSSLDEMIASIDEGYLLEGFFSGMEDPKNWGIQCVASRAKEIKNGKLTGKVHSPIYITGYVPDLLSSITRASDDLVILGNGTCAKGYKERVKTATGGPYLKAKGRLS